MKTAYSYIHFSSSRQVDGIAIAKEKGNYKGKANY